MPGFDVSPGIDTDFEIGYDQITANVLPASTTEASGDLVIQCSAYVFDGKPVMFEFFCYGFSLPTGQNDTMVLSLFEGATQITRLAQLRVADDASALASVSGLFRYRFTPTAGVHTYKVTVFCTPAATGSPVIRAGSGGTAGVCPAYARFTKV